MRKKSKTILMGVLLVGNGYLILCWLHGASETNEVGRQWNRIIIPCMMLLFSLGISAIVWIADRVTKKKIKGIEQEAGVVREPRGGSRAPQP